MRLTRNQLSLVRVVQDNYGIEAKSIDNLDLAMKACLIRKGALTENGGRLYVSLQTQRGFSR